MSRADELQTLLADAQATVVELTNRQVLYHQGESCGDVYLVQSGYLKFAHIDTEGAAVISAILSAGELFGSGLESERRCRHTVTAKGEASLRRYSAVVFQEFLFTKNRLAWKVINMLTVRQHQGSLTTGVKRTMSISGYPPQGKNHALGATSNGFRSG